MIENQRLFESMRPFLAAFLTKKITMEMKIERILECNFQHSTAESRTRNINRRLSLNLLLVYANKAHRLIMNSFSFDFTFNN